MPCCGVCNTAFGKMCRFSETLFIHPKCGLLSTSGLKKMFGSKKAVLSAIASRKCRTAAGPIRFGNQSEMYILSEFQTVLKEEETRLGVSSSSDQKKKLPSNSYLAAVVKGEVATSLSLLVEKKHLNDNVWLSGRGDSVANCVKKSCRAYKAGLLAEHPKQRGFRGKRDVFILLSKYKKVRKQNKTKKTKATTTTTTNSQEVGVKETNEKSFACSDCDKSYTKAIGLYQHRYLKHGHRSSSKTASSNNKRKANNVDLSSNKNNNGGIRTNKKTKLTSQQHVE